MELIHIQIGNITREKRKGPYVADRSFGWSENIKSKQLVIIRSLIEIRLGWIIKLKLL